MEIEKTKEEDVIDRLMKICQSYQKLTIKILNDWKFFMVIDIILMLMLFVAGFLLGIIL